VQNLQMYKCQITFKRKWKNFKIFFQKLLKQNVKMTKSFYDLIIVQWVKTKSRVVRGNKTLGVRNRVASHGKEHVGFCNSGSKARIQLAPKSLSFSCIFTIWNNLTQKKKQKNKQNILFPFFKTLDLLKTKKILKLKTMFQFFNPNFFLELLCYI